jgi:hypothetical protein
VHGISPARFVVVWRHSPDGVSAVFENVAAGLANGLAVTFVVVAGVRYLTAS